MNIKEFEDDHIFLITNSYKSSIICDCGESNLDYQDLYLDKDLISMSGLCDKCNIVYSINKEISSTLYWLYKHYITYNIKFIHLVIKFLEGGYENDKIKFVAQNKNKEEL